VWHLGAHHPPVAEEVRGMDTSKVRGLRELEAENARLKRILAQQAMDIDALKELLRGEW